MQTAAAIAGTFHINPIDVLNSNSEEWAIHIAALGYYVEAKEKAQTAFAAKQKSHK